MIDFFKGYIEELIYVAIFVIIIELILPKGNMKKYVYSVVSIIIILLLISPVINLNGETSIKGAIDNVIETISKSSESNIVSNEIIDFNNFKDSIISHSVKNKIEKDIREKLNNIELKLQRIDLEVTDEYKLEEIVIYIESLGVEENKSINKASEAISLLASEYKIDNSKIKIIELGGM